MKHYNDLSDRQNGEVFTNKNLKFLLPINRARPKDNSTIKFLDSLTAPIRLVTKKCFSHLNIKPQQEIDIVLFSVLVVRYLALFIILLLLGSSINLKPIANITGM